MIVALAVIVPLFGVILLGFIDARATRLLQATGVSVGLFGVPKAEMYRLIESSCNHCGYDIRDLPGPTCPECGTSLPTKPA